MLNLYYRQFKALKEMHLEHQKESSICQGKTPPEFYKQTASLRRVQLTWTEVVNQLTYKLTISVFNNLTKYFQVVIYIWGIIKQF